MRDDEYREAFFDGVMSALTAITGIMAIGWFIYLSVAQVIK